MQRSYNLDTGNARNFELTLLNANAVCKGREVKEQKSAFSEMQSANAMDQKPLRR